MRMSKLSYKQVIIFLDTDKHASPFDMLMANDLYPNARIFYYSNVEAEDAKKLVQDAMFPRGPKGAKHTKIFIGGYNAEKAEAILEMAEKVMFPPFEIAVIMDPRGAHTTGPAMVAKALNLSLKKGFGDFKGKKIVVLAGTGPVGRIVSHLCGSEGAEVSITSRSQERASSVANRINGELGVERVHGFKAATAGIIGKVISDADVILSTGTAGIQLMPKKVLKEYGKRCKVVADINAIPPLGIEGLRPDDDSVEVLHGVWGIGALTIGTLKNEIEAELFKKAMEAKRGVFDYKVAYQTAKSLLKILT
jgi:hypothetical protein